MNNERTGGRAYGPGYPASQQVAWWPVHEFVAALIAQAGTLPAAGTPAWCALADTDPRKLLALAEPADHHVLRVEVAQTAMAEASQEISQSADWSAVAQRVRNGRGAAYIKRQEVA